MQSPHSPACRDRAVSVLGHRPKAGSGRQALQPLRQVGRGPPSGDVRCWHHTGPLTLMPACGAGALLPLPNEEAEPQNHLQKAEERQWGVAGTPGSPRGARGHKAWQGVEEI